jgi:hypothetical protein
MVQLDNAILGMDVVGSKADEQDTQKRNQK